ncbi:MAG: hypothetical protein JZU70_11895 [Chlorobium sp.]|jgi:hypothetical protein|nr:hypothetical protein [Chlorobium sp.]
MGKRQIIYRQSSIGGNQELLNREINLVTKESRVWNGRVVAVGTNEIEVKDARAGKHRFTVDQIDRIYYDVKTEY